MTATDSLVSQEVTDVPRGEQKKRNVHFDSEIKFYDKSCSEKKDDQEHNSTSARHRYMSVMLKIKILLVATVCGCVTILVVIMNHEALEKLTDAKYWQGMKPTGARDTWVWLVLPSGGEVPLMALSKKLLPLEDNIPVAMMTPRMFYLSAKSSSSSWIRGPKDISVHNKMSLAAPSLDMRSNKLVDSDASETYLEGNATPLNVRSNTYREDDETLLHDTYRQEQATALHVRSDTYWVEEETPLLISRNTYRVDEVTPLHDKSDTYRQGEATPLHDKSDTYRQGEATPLHDKSDTYRQGEATLLHNKSDTYRQGEATPLHGRSETYREDEATPLHDRNATYQENKETPLVLRYFRRKRELCGSPSC